MQATAAIGSHIGWSNEHCPKAALSSIFEGTDVGQANLGIVFLSSRYNLDDAAKAIRQTFTCPVLACTTAGELSRSGYHEAGMVAGALHGVEATTAYIDNVTAFSAANGRAVAKQLKIDSGGRHAHRAAVLLADGLSHSEEYLAAHLYQAFGELPLGGGSAGDDGKFAQTHVYDGTRFRSGGAMVGVVESPAPIHVFAHHHFTPTQTRLVITSANPEQRIIHEINGKKAAIGFAEALGADANDLDTAFLSIHPLMLQIGENSYIRGFQSLLPNGDLQLYCAIEEGLVLCVGAPDDMGQRLHNLVNGPTFDDAALVLGFDCIMRCVESQAKHCTGDLSAAFAHLPLIGFSTYGEQYNGIHVNQTLTGLVFRNN